MKHAEGRAAEDLRKIRSDLFILPNSTLFKPLFGEDFFVRPEDITSHTDAIAEFWEELAIALEKHARAT